jgi:hypothetical protein
MFEYGALASCACAFRPASIMTTIAKLDDAIVLRAFHCVEFSWDTYVPRGPFSFIVSR